MTDNNTKNIKYIDTSDILYKPDNQITKPVADLLRFSQKGDFANLKELLDEKDFLDSTINLAFRNLLSNDFKIHDPNYLNSYKYLLSSNIDFNFKFAKDNNSTILMKVTKAGQLILMKEFLESFYQQIKNRENINHFQTSEEEKDYFLTQQEILFSQKDKNNSNFLHYMIHFNKCENSEIFEYLYEEYPFEKKREEDCSKKIQEMIKNLIKEKNDEGNNFMNICLLHGMPYLVLKIIEIIGYIPNLNKKNNNYIHSAVLGGNMTCLKILLNYSEFNDLTAKNDDMLTPAQLAYKLGYYSMSNIINEYRDNFQDELYKEYFFKNLEHYDKSNNIHFLVNFTNYKFKHLLYELNEMKIINNLSISDSSYINKNEEDLNYKISNIKMDWNLLLTKMKQFECESDKDIENNNKISNNNKSGKNNKKKGRKSEEKNKNSIYPFVKSIFEFYEVIFSDNIINSFIVYKSKEDDLININQNIDLLLFNKIIFYFNTGHFKLLLNTALIYLIDIYQKENSNNNSDFNFNNRTLILYINITCILIESFLYHGYQDIVDITIKALDKFLYTKSLNLGDVQYNSDDKIIFDYLNIKEILNPFISNWHHLFIYSNFLKLLNDKSRECLSEFHKNLEESNNKKQPSIIKRYYILYDCLDIKKSYDKNNYDLINKIENFNLKQKQERQIYYFNILGIIFLKKKKFYLSKSFFQKGFKNYLQTLRNKNDTNYDDKFINFRIDYITAFLYNISLCNFYLREFEKCSKILELLLIFENNKNNYFLYYRLALCYLEIYLQYIKKNNNSFNHNINKLYGYENNKNNSKIRNDKSISINIENESSENLSAQLESKDNNTKGTDDNKSPDFIDKDMASLFYNFCNYNFNEFKDTKVKKIIIRNIKENTITKKTNNAQHSEFQLQIRYIDKAIKSFKKILVINKINLYSNSIKSINEFFFSIVKDDLNTKGTPYKKRKIPNDLIINTYLYMLFCLSLKNNWLEILFTIKDFNQRKVTMNKIITLKLLLYQLEAYINLDKQSKIVETINKINSHKKNDFTLFDKSNNDVIKKINIKLYLYYSLTLIHYKEKNYHEMEIYANKLLILIQNEKDIPYYIIDLLINVYIIKLNIEPNINQKNKYKYNNIILNLIKNKKINKAD